MRRVGWLLLAACGGSSPALDAPPQGSDAARPIDASAGSCDAAASYTAAPTDAAATLGDDGSLDLTGNLDAVTVLEITLYPGTGDFPGSAVAPESDRSLAGSDAQFATCGTCVLVYGGVSTSSGVPIAGATYLASGGTISVTSTTPTFAGTLTDVTLARVHIDEQTNESVPVGDGCTTSVPSLAFSADVGSATLRRTP